MSDLELTLEDRAWLRAMEQACQRDPVPMVSVEQYMLAVNAADAITRENYKLHVNRRRLWKRYKRTSRRAERVHVWRAVSILLGTALGILVFELGRRG